MSDFYNLKNNLLFRSDYFAHPYLEQLHQWAQKRFLGTNLGSGFESSFGSNFGSDFWNNFLYLVEKKTYFTVLTFLPLTILVEVEELWEFPKLCV